MIRSRPFLELYKKGREFFVVRRFFWIESEQTERNGET